MYRLENAIKIYTSRGWVVHPLESPYSNTQYAGKKPLLKGWQNLTVTPQLSMFPEDCNIGIVCGKTSGVTIIDFDDDTVLNTILKDLNIRTLQSGRTIRRGHLFFKYSQILPSSKHNWINIEVLNDGSNAVIPPSIHKSGAMYQFNKEEVTEMTPEFIRRLQNAFDLEKSLKNHFKDCRPCLQIMKEFPVTPNMHGTKGRLLMLASATELLQMGATSKEIHLLSLMLYKKEYSYELTEKEIRGIDPWKSWRCETIKEKLDINVNCTTCKKHEKTLKIKIPQGTKQLIIDIE